jgi:hypothetical protein
MLFFRLQSMHASGRLEDFNQWASQHDLGLVREAYALDIPELLDLTTVYTEDVIAGKRKRKSK